MFTFSNVMIFRVVHVSLSRVKDSVKKNLTSLQVDPSLIFKTAIRFFLSSKKKHLKKIGRRALCMKWKVTFACASTHEGPWRLPELCCCGLWFVSTCKGHLLCTLSTAAIYALHSTYLFFLLVSLFVFFDAMTVKWLVYSGPSCTGIKV